MQYKYTGLTICICNTTFIVLVYVQDSTMAVLCSVSDIISCSTIGSLCYFLTSQGAARCVELCSLTDYIETLLEPASVAKAIQVSLGNKSILRKHGLLLLRMQELITSRHQQYQVCMYGKVEECHNRL